MLYEGDGKCPGGQRTLKERRLDRGDVTLIRKEARVGYK